MLNNKNIIVTGGSGFIGGTLIRRLLRNTNSKIFNIDKLSYASSDQGIFKIKTADKRYTHLKIDLAKEKDLEKTFFEVDPDFVFHFAAESHVDRSLENPFNFIQSNILGTYNLLEVSKKHFKNLSKNRKRNFKFHHISTDEVFGSLGKKGKFNESTKYDPRSPYSASKASSDHLVNAWYHSFDLPILISNCSNNYGPFQFPEKLIPLTILNCINQKSIPLYGDGLNIRDWIFVEDHIDAILLIAEKGQIGQNYCIGGNQEKKNIDVISEICTLMDQLNPRTYKHKNLIQYVDDRLGHDRRYAIDNTFINKELNWYPKVDFQKGLKRTVQWYMDNLVWCQDTLNINK